MSGNGCSLALDGLDPCFVSDAVYLSALRQKYIKQARCRKTAMGPHWRNPNRDDRVGLPSPIPYHCAQRNLDARKPGGTCRRPTARGTSGAPPEALSGPKRAHRQGRAVLNRLTCPCGLHSQPGPTPCGRSPRPAACFGRFAGKFF